MSQLEVRLDRIERRIGKLFNMMRTNRAFDGAGTQSEEFTVTSLASKVHGRTADMVILDDAINYMDIVKLMKTYGFGRFFADTSPSERTNKLFTGSICLEDLYLQ